MSNKVSIVIPACDAQRHLPRAVKSALSQTHRDIEVIVVSDDGLDYATFLAAQGISDPRLRHASTGGVRTGCHNARNAGYAVARGDFIADLDADDLFHPARVETLLPHAQSAGAVVDNIAVISDRNGGLLYKPFNNLKQNLKLDAVALIGLTCPLFPLIRRDAHRPRTPGIEYAEDVVANLQLIGRLGAILVVGATLSDYRVIAGSLSHDDSSAARFEQSYTDIIARAQSGDLGLPAAMRDVAIEGFARKRDLNRALAQAQSENPALDFQTFVAQRRKVT